MATTRLIPLHTGKGRNFGKAIRNVIGYVSNPKKTHQGELVTGFGCNPETADGEFLLMKREYIARTGRRRGKDDVIAYHLRQSFVPGEITPEEANRIGCELASRFTHGQHAYVVATHEDRRHVHSHIIISAVNLDCDRKFRNFWGSSKAIRRLSDTLCIQNGLSIIEQPKGRGKSYNKWLGNEAKTSQRDGLREALDAALARQPKDFEELLTMLQRGGWEVKRGKRISLKGKRQERFKRLDSLGEDYSEAALRAIIAGEKEHHPREKKTVQPMRQVNLLVDIQAMLQYVGQFKKARAFQQIINDLRICFSGIEVSRHLRRQSQFVNFIILSIRDSGCARKKVGRYVKSSYNADDIFIAELVRFFAQKTAEKAVIAADFTGKFRLRNIIALHQIRKSLPDITG